MGEGEGREGVREGERVSQGGRGTEEGLRVTETIVCMYIIHVYLETFVQQ